MVLGWHNMDTSRIYMDKLQIKLLQSNQQAQHRGPEGIFKMSKNTRKTSLHNFCHYSVAGGLQPFTNSSPLARLPVFFKGLRHNLIISPNLSIGLKWRCKPTYLEETCIRGGTNTNCRCIGSHSAWDKNPQPSIYPPRENTKINGTLDFSQQLWNETFLPSNTCLKTYQKLKEDKKRKNNTDC